ncbi:hypothetical protein NKI48_25680 [Mesorhizobium sp. M0644]|uniref:hypothetical protein n=1 Tax=unclassified Mesorhizobium TaxID=325217 RepID=UPI0033359696
MSYVAGFFKIRCDRSGAGDGIRIWLFSGAATSVVQSRHRSTFVFLPEAGHAFSFVARAADS